MPFYLKDKQQVKPGSANPNQFAFQIPGEFMKAGVVVKPEGEGPPLHSHPNEEQFTIVLEGKMHYILGDEERIAGPGDIIHIPRNTKHRSRSVGGEAKFFTIKSPCGDGNLDQDYNKAEGAETAEKSYPGKKD